VNIRVKEEEIAI